MKNKNKDKKKTKKEQTTYTVELNKQRSEDDKKDSVVKLMELDYEHQAASEAAGQEAEVYGVWGTIYKISKFFGKKKKHSVIKKKTYLWLMLFTGWMGGHRWYQKRYVLAAIYTALFWTGIPLILCVTDAMEVIPVKADENGMITL